MSTATPEAPVDTAVPPRLAVNRISIPFLRVQERRWLLGTVDVALTMLWLAAVYRVWRALAHPTPYTLPHMPWEWVIGGGVSWLVVSWLAGAYELTTADRFRSAARVTLAVAGINVVIALAAYYGFLKTYPRPALTVTLLGLPLSVLVWRGMYAAFLRRPADATRLLLVGDASLCAVLVEAAQSKEDYYQVLGFLSEDEAVGARCLGQDADIGSIAERYAAHRIVVAPRHSLSPEAISALSGCIERGVEVVDFNAAYEEITEKVAVDHAGDFWLSALPTGTRASAFEEASMRLLDVAGAVLGLLVTALVSPFIAAAILVESGRPVLYRQERLGRGGRPFTIVKFRSMRHDAERTGPSWAAPEDRRATRVGRWLRRTHLDELPQFWNVLRGEMSLVGPRPERREFTEELARTIPFYRLRHAVRPGLTGLKQIRVGYAGTTEEHLEVLRHDLYYIKHRSLALNLLIIARTAGPVLGMHGR